MNLAAIANSAITVINENQIVLLSVSTGYDTTPDGTRVPTYNNQSVQAQIQALSGRDLRQIEGLNLNGTLRAIYLYGDVEATVRAMQKGGDVITDTSNNQWLVVQVLETWPDWCKCVIVLQNAGVA